MSQALWPCRSSWFSCFFLVFCCFFFVFVCVFFGFARPNVRMQRVESFHLFFLANQCICQNREYVKRSAKNALSQSPVLKINMTALPLNVPKVSANLMLHCWTGHPFRSICAVLSHHSLHVTPTPKSWLERWEYWYLHFISFPFHPVFRPYLKS